MNGYKYDIQKSQLILRLLTPNDLDEIKILCDDWFPLKYPDSWYEDVTSKPNRFYSLAATRNKRIIALLIVEIKSLLVVNPEDRGILDSSFGDTCRAAYIMTLGVIKEYRRHGLATLLLDTLLTMLSHNRYSDVKAVYLHVLCTNVIAMRFYERRKFFQHLLLPYYYMIHGIPQDGYSYVLYINGGFKPRTMCDKLESIISSLLHLKPCLYVIGVGKSIFIFTLQMISAPFQPRKTSLPLYVTTAKRSSSNSIVSKDDNTTDVTKNNSSFSIVSS